MSKWHEIVVTVEAQHGRPAFPVDMLRYDGLHPNTEIDSYRIAAAVEYSGRDTGVIELRKWDDKRWQPCTGRWESFGWRVTDVRTTGRTQ